MRKPCENSMFPSVFDGNSAPQADDTFVSKLLESVPPAALARAVPTEQGLQQRLVDQVTSWAAS